MIFDLATLDLLLDIVLKLLLIGALLIFISLLREAKRALESAEDSMESAENLLKKLDTYTSARKVWKKIKGGSDG